MRVLVLVTSRRKPVSAEALALQIPQSIKSSSSFEVFAALHPQGPGANQKVGFRYALEKGFDAVAVVAESMAPALEKLPEMAALMQDRDADLVLGTAGQGIITRALSAVQNLLAATSLQTWHSGLRLYNTRVFKEIAFDLNANGDVFATEVLLQMLYHGHSIQLFALPAGTARAASPWLSLKATIKYRLQRYHLFYDVRYHPEVLTNSPSVAALIYNEKPHSQSPHSLVASDDELLKPGTTVLDVGCASGYMGKWLKEAKGCRVTGIDLLPKDRVRDGLEAYFQLDVEAEREQFLKIVREGHFDAILALDIIEHMTNPELFLWSLSKTVTQKANNHPPLKIVVSTGNVAFLAVRLMLFLGHFNYGQKGILDITHKRLFSYHTFKNLLVQTGYTIEAERYCPLPFAELGLPRWLSRALESVNLFLIRLRPRLFAYQVMFAATPLASPQRSLVRIQ